MINRFKQIPAGNDLRGFNVSFKHSFTCKMFYNTKGRRSKSDRLPLLFAELRSSIQLIFLIHDAVPYNREISKT